MNIKDKVAFITGAGSGIGRAIAQSLAKRGCHLALSDVNAEGLGQTAEQVSLFGVRVSQHVLDVTDRESILGLPGAIEQQHGGVDILINNAGIAAGGTFLQVSEETFDRVMDINFHAVVRMTRAFLPYLQKRKEALIVNISSLYGLVSPIEQSAYSASKFAVRGFSNALRHELEHTSVRVTVVHPGGVATNIAKHAVVPDGVTQAEAQLRLSQVEKLLSMPPERAGEIIVRGIEQNKARVIVGADAQFVALIERFMPVHYWKVLKALTKMREK
jgi:short-subunit dehydrogenase